MQEMCDFTRRKHEMEKDSNASHWGDQQPMMHSREHNQQQTTEIWIFTVKKTWKIKSSLSKLSLTVNTMKPKHFWTST